MKLETFWRKQWQHRWTSFGASTPAPSFNTRGGMPSRPCDFFGLQKLINLRISYKDIKKWGRVLWCGSGRLKWSPVELKEKNVPNKLAVPRRGSYTATSTEYRWAKGLTELLKVFLCQTVVGDTIQNLQSLMITAHQTSFWGSCSLQTNSSPDIFLGTLQSQDKENLHYSWQVYIDWMADIGGICLPQFENLILLANCLRAHIKQGLDADEGREKE